MQRLLQKTIKGLSKLRENYLNSLTKNMRGRDVSALDLKFAGIVENHLQKNIKRSQNILMEHVFEPTSS